MACKNCGGKRVYGVFGITELAYYECADCGATYPSNWRGDEEF